MTHNRHGDFVWYELMTTDIDEAQDFYGGLLGWAFAEASFGDVTYRAFSAAGEQIGGFLKLSEDMIGGGARPAWLGYVGVDDLAAALEAWRQGGGSVMFGPTEVPDVGPMAMTMDPQGAPLYLIEDRSGQPSTAFAAERPILGHCAWNELMTADRAAVEAFFGEQFGWVVGDSMDMGPMGSYDMMQCGAQRSFMFGAIMNKPDEMPLSLWNYYFRVPRIEDAVAFITAHGGQIINGPMEIPGGDHALTGIDPQGAMFSLVGAAPEG